MRRILLWLFILASSAAAFGAERFPPPDFTNGHRLPVTPTPLPRADFFYYIDIGMLVLALGLASYFVIWKRSRGAIAGLAIFSLIYFGFYRQGCVCPIGAIQNAALAISDRTYALPFVVGAFLLIPMIFTLFFGRVFCAAVCPLGAAQDVVLKSPAKLPAWLVQPLSVLPWVYLGAAVLYAATGTTFLICRYDPFVAFFRLGGSAGMIAFGAAMLILGTVVGRPYCRFLCPYGAILRLLAPLAKWRVTITPSECVGCRLCEESCPFGEIRVPNTADNIKRGEGRGRLAALLALLPIIVLAGALLGRMGSAELSRVDPGVRLAEKLWAEEHGSGRGAVNETKAFYKTGQPTAVAYKRAIEVERRFVTGSALFGGWIGLVIGLKLIGLSIRRRRTEYEADISGCIGCGRCYWSCPVERARVGDPEAARMLEEQPWLK